VDPLVDGAFARRADLHDRGDLDCYRLLHGWSEGLPGVEVDRYGDTLVIEIRPEAEALVEALASGFERHRRFERAVVRSRQRPVTTRLVRGAPPPDGQVIVTEAGLRFLVEPLRAGNPGLYLDARPARAWIRDHSAGRRILNLFAFSGSLGVAAAAGGARSILHVDASDAVLAWCRANHALNGLAI